MSVIVTLQCVREGSRLRVKILTAGYHHGANCQFPRNIRVENARYQVPAEHVRLARGPRGKFFYRVNKNHVTVLPPEQAGTTQIKLDKVYGDNDTPECVVCMAEDKSKVFVPCGHYVCCADCASIVKGTTSTCPMCRGAIELVVNRQDIG